MRRAPLSMRLAFPRLLTMAGLVALASCGGAPAATPPRSAAAPALAGTAPPSEPAMPRSVESLVDVIPSDAVLVASVPQAGAFLAAAAPVIREALLEELTAVVARRPGLSPDLARDLAASLEGAAVFAGGDAARRGALRALLEHGCVAARFRDGAPVERLLKELPREAGEGRFALRDGEDNVVAHGAWLAEARVALVCTRPEPLSKALRVAGQREPSFKASALFQPQRAKEPWLAIDLHRLQRSGADGPEPGSRLFIALPMSQDMPGLHAELAVYGREVPALGAVLAATDHAAVAKLPQGALATVGLSLQRSPGKTVSDVLGAFDGLAGEPTAAAAAAALAEVGLELGDVDRALGGEAAVGIYRDPKHKLSLAGARRAEALRHSAVLIALATADEAAQKKVFGAVAAHMKRTTKKLRAKPGSLAHDLDDGNELRAETRPGFVLIGAGDRGYLAQVAARFGKDKESLAATPSFAEARARAKGASHLQLYIDRQAFAGLLDGAVAASFGALAASPTLVSVALAPSDRGLDLTLSGHGGVEILGASAALAVYGVRRYINSAKAAAGHDLE